MPLQKCSSDDLTLLQNVGSEPQKSGNTSTAELAGRTSEWLSSRARLGRNTEAGASNSGCRTSGGNSRSNLARSRRSWGEDTSRRHQSRGRERPVGDSDGLAGSGSVGRSFLGTGHDEGGVAGADGDVGLHCDG